MVRLATRAGGMMALAIWLALAAAPALAQGLSALARVVTGPSQVHDSGDELWVDMRLTQAVPWRSFTLGDPMRLVVDFHEVDWSGVDRAAFLNSDHASDLHFGTFHPGWSRLVVDLRAPMRIVEAGMQTDAGGGAARLRIKLAPTDADSFAAEAGAPPDPVWDDLAGPSLPAPQPVADDTLTIVIDPGHGGIDPGAERDGQSEAQLMLAFGRELAEAINRTQGLRAVLTRESDVFVPLEERITRARAAGAGLFLSLHADALDDSVTAGAVTYTLAAGQEDEAAARMAERHERGDILAGVDLTGQDDHVAAALMDLARAETLPASQRFALDLIVSLGNSGASLNDHPVKEALLAVLTPADYPAVLLEAGFMSNAADMETLSTPEGRAPLLEAIIAAIQGWRAEEAARAPLLRQ